MNMEPISWHIEEIAVLIHCMTDPWKFEALNGFKV